jgi:hypothetical protein
MARRLSEIAGKIVRRLSCCSDVDDDEQQGPEELELRPVPHPEEPRPDKPENEPAGHGQGELRTETQVPPKYGKFQESGAKLRRWIEDPTEPNCLIPRSILTFDVLQAAYPGIAMRTGARYHGEDLDLGPPNELDISGDTTCQYFSLSHRNIVWAGHTRRGEIFINDIIRDNESDAPPISQVTQALYERHFALADLKYIFLTTIIHPDTSDFVKYKLYVESNALRWPTETPQIWRFGTPEYDALLGTRIGKVVAYFLLGAFPRGTRRIREVITWPSWSGGSVHMRFEIEAIR